MIPSWLKSVENTNTASKELTRMMYSRTQTLSWEETRDFLSEYLGLWKDVKVTAKEEEYLHHIYDVTIAKNDPGSVKDEFDHTDNSIIANEATRMLGRKAGIKWGSNGHSSAYVPVYAIGPGTEIFSSRNDNTDMAKKIAAIAGYK